MIQTAMRKKLFATFLGLIVLFTSIGGLSAFGQRRRHRRTYYTYHHHSRTKGALIGGAAGLIGGALIGGGKGALIGAGAGAGTGALVQHVRNQRSKRRVRRYYR
jgi:osmotically inducible lipoprotein OsmB